MKLRKFDLFDALRFVTTVRPARSFNQIEFKKQLQLKMKRMRRKRITEKELQVFFFGEFAQSNQI